MERTKYTTEWMITHAIDITKQFPDGLTLRGLYYQLVKRGMTNDNKHYHKVCVAMKKARWDKVLRMDCFVDREREMYGQTDASIRTVESNVEKAKGAELFDLTEKYGAKLQAYQIFGVMEIVKAKRFHDIGTHYDQVISGNLCDNKHPDAPHIRCTKKRNHSGLCGTGGPDDNEIMWDV